MTMYRFSVGRFSVLLAAAVAASAPLVAANDSAYGAAAQLADITGIGRLEAISLANQAERNLGAGRYEAAAAGYRRALPLQRRFLGTSHPKVAVSLLGLAKAELALGKPDEALRAQEKALDIRRRKLAPDSWLIAAVHDGISGTLVALGRFDDAARARRKDIAIHEKHLGRHHATLGALWLDYAKLLHKAGRAEEAARAETRGHEIYARAPHGGPAAPPSPALPPEVKAVTSGPVTAHFGAEKPEDGSSNYWTMALWFSFAGDDTVYPFRPGGSLFSGEWRYGIFSPGGKHVLLPRDRYGPYHVVRTSRLKDYLLGRAKADEIVGQIAKAGEIAAIHADARWLSATELRYVAICCGQQLIRTHRLRRQHGAVSTASPAVAYRPGLGETLGALPSGADRLVELARAYLAYAERARRNPGRWGKGRIEQGAKPREYVPSDDELILAELGGRLVEVVEKKGWGQVTDELGAAGMRLDEIAFREFTFRHVDVMGTGRFHYVSAPREVRMRRQR